jgi:aryl-alcohol dehydrogenase-like predicted oxidoreductase
MEHRTLGAPGLKIPALVLGTVPFGGGTPSTP